MEDELRSLARKYALQNAVHHEGKADPKAILGKILAERADLRAKARELGPIIASEVETVNALNVEHQRSELQDLEPALLVVKKREQRTGLKHLPDWDKVAAIVMRFAPNPNGPATVGHSRGMVIHAEYQRMYRELGKPFTMILRYDDTDPGVKPPIKEAYGSLLEDFKWLGGAPHRVVKASERIDHYYEHAEKLIGVGGAYVCNCAQETFKALKDAAEPCPHRGRSKKENLAEWKRMLKGDYEPGQAVLRVATDIKHPNSALRDWVAFRIVTTPHPIVGTKYRVWPLLDFESAIEDHLQGVTHITRGKDLIDSEHKQTFVYNYFGWTYPRTAHWGRVKVHEFGKVSKSLFVEGIKSGKYTGWDDLRLPTLAALRRRGFEAEALRAFWVSMGLTEKDVAASLDSLEAENRKIVEKTANRYFFVADPKPVAIEGLPPEGIEGHAPLHPDDPKRGTRKVRLGGKRPGSVLLASEDLDGFRKGTVFRLKDWGNLEIIGPGRARYAGNDLSILQRGAPIVQWCSAVPAAALPTELAMADEEGTVRKGMAEAAVAQERGRVVQFERVGFARIESVEGLVRAAFAHS